MRISAFPLIFQPKPPYWASSQHGLKACPLHSDTFQATRFSGKKVLTAQERWYELQKLADAAIRLRKYSIATEALSDLYTPFNANHSFEQQLQVGTTAYKMLYVQRMMNQPLNLLGFDRLVHSFSQAFPAYIRGKTSTDTVGAQYAGYTMLHCLANTIPFISPNQPGYLSRVREVYRVIQDIHHTLEVSVSKLNLTHHKGSDNPVKLAVTEGDYWYKEAEKTKELEKQRALSAQAIDAYKRGLSISQQFYPKVERYQHAVDLGIMHFKLAKARQFSNTDASEDIYHMLMAFNQATTLYMEHCNKRMLQDKTRQFAAPILQCLEQVPNLLSEDSQNTETMVTASTGLMLLLHQMCGRTPSRDIPDAFAETNVLSHLLHHVGDGKWNELLKRLIDNTAQFELFGEDE